MLSTPTPKNEFYSKSSYPASFVAFFAIFILFICFFVFYLFSSMAFLALPKGQRKKRPQDEFEVSYFRMINVPSIKGLLTY